MQHHIKGIVDEITNKFSTASCRYEYHYSSDTHFIEVLPLELYQSDSFKEYHGNLILSFMDEYPYESICLVSSDSAIKLKDIIYEKSGISASTINVSSASEHSIVIKQPDAVYPFSYQTFNLAA